MRFNVLQWTMYWDQIQLAVHVGHVQTCLACIIYHLADGYKSCSACSVSRSKQVACGLSFNLKALQHSVLWSSEITTCTKRSFLVLYTRYLWSSGITTCTKHSFLVLYTRYLCSTFCWLNVFATIMAPHITNPLQCKSRWT